MRMYFVCVFMRERERECVYVQVGAVSEHVYFCLVSFKLGMMKGIACAQETHLTENLYFTVRFTRHSEWNDERHKDGILMLVKNSYL